MNTFFDMHELVHLPGLSVVIFWVPGFQGSVNPERGELCDFLGRQVRAPRADSTAAIIG